MTLQNKYKCKSKIKNNCPTLRQKRAEGWGIPRVRLERMGQPPAPPTLRMTLQNKYKCKNKIKVNCPTLRQKRAEGWGIPGDLGWKG
jgi:hypothetical protein